MPTGSSSGRCSPCSCVTIFCCIRLRDSRLGRAWIAIREDETAAGAMGIPLMRTKTWAYAIGAFFGGVAGAYIASFNSVARPEPVQLQHLDLPALHGHPRRDGQHLGRGRRRRDPVLAERRRPREHRRLARTATLPLTLRGGQVPVRDLRRHPGADDALPTRGADPRAPAQARARRGRAADEPSTRCAAPTSRARASAARRKPEDERAPGRGPRSMRERCARSSAASWR